jgi:hypothetical protein
LAREADGAGVAIGPTGSTGASLSMLTTGASLAVRQSGFASSLEYEQLFLPFMELPARWLDYSCFDVVTLSVDELKFVNASNPKALAAITRWARAGGQLWILNAGEGWQKLPSIEQSLQLKGAPAAALDGDEEQELTLGELRERGWRPTELVPQDWTGRVVTFGEYNSGTQRVVRDARTIERLQRNPRYYIITDQTVPAN